MTLEDDNLIALDAGGFVDGLRVEPCSAEVSFCPGDKKCRRPVDFVEASKIEITAIHDIDGPNLDDQLVEDIDIVDFPRGDDNHRRNVSVQIQEGMEFYRSLAFPELGPREKSQTEVDGRRIQGIDCLIQFDSEGIGGVKFSGFRDKDLSKVGINPPVPVLICVGKSVAGDLSSDAQVIKSGLCCPQADLDISQAFAISKLGECHAEVLVPTGKADYFVVAVVSVDAFSELVCGDKVHQLSKDRFPEIHALPPHSLMRETGTSGENISNR